MRRAHDRVLHAGRPNRLFREALRPQERLRRFRVGSGHGEQHEPLRSGVLRSLQGAKHAAVVRVEQLVRIRLRDAADQVDHRVASREDLRERVRGIDLANGHFRPQLAQVGGIGRSADRGSDLVTRQQRPHRRTADHAGRPGHHDGHAGKAIARRLSDSGMDTAPASRGVAPATNC
jgi:hypothetical protein